MDAIKYIENRNKSLNDTKTSSELPVLEALEFWPYQVILIVIYSTTAFISLTSNLVTIVVLLKGDRISSELWKYLINLSVSDIVLSLLSIPFTYTSFMLNHWIFSTQLCPIVNFAQTCSVFVSVWTLTVIGIDRYNAIIHPLREASTISEWLRNNKWFLISLLWLTGMLVGGAQLLYSRAVPFIYGDQLMYDCREVWDDNWGRSYTVIVFVTTFALPLSILVFVYSSIAFHIWRHVIPGNSDKQRDDTQRNRKDKILQT
ncbi:RYamide receptor-like [Oppia nitens]|uniref:RYamide receptor-like n=1 Tax=Oppia nitens TaxID=1686743 RepID=UPI0023D9F78B|nr:RYamide receptor-like [Oppia nitens]